MSEEIGVAPHPAEDVRAEVARKVMFLRGELGIAAEWSTWLLADRSVESGDESAAYFRWQRMATVLTNVSKVAALTAELCRQEMKRMDRDG